MNKSRLILLAALLSASSALPALAAWDRIGSVDVGFRHGRDTAYTDFGGPIESLQLRAEDSTIRCSSVHASFANGRDREIFSGTLRRDLPVNIDLPGNRRQVTRIEFSCRADRPRGGTIQILADVGQYQSEWRHSPNWDRVWSKTFAWGREAGAAIVDTSRRAENAVSNAVNEWQMIGSERFEGRDDSQQTFAGWQGRRTDAVALMPVDADARCTRVTARFGNRGDQNLNVNNGDYLRKGVYYKLDLPGDYRNLQSLYLQCRATDAPAVTIQIFVSK